MITYTSTIDYFKIIFIKILIYLACASRRRLMAALAVRAAGVAGIYAPPVVALPHFKHFQTPTTVLLTDVLPQNGHGYVVKSRSS